MTDTRRCRACFLFRNAPPAATGYRGRPVVSKSEAEFERAWRHGRAGPLSFPGPASSRETSRSGIGNRRDASHGPRRVSGAPRLTSPRGCYSCIHRLAGLPTPFLSVPGRTGPRSAPVRGAVRSVQRSSRPCLLAPPPAQPAAVAGGCPTESPPDPAHRPAEISTVTGGAAEVGAALCRHINHLPLQEVSPHRRPPGPRQGPSAFYFVTTTS